MHTFLRPHKAISTISSQTFISQILMKVNEEPEYDPEVIANAHLTMEDDHYKCSVCKMKFKQPGNARRHIITVHR